METRGTSIDSGNRSNYTWQHPKELRRRQSEDRVCPFLFKKGRCRFLGRIVPNPEINWKEARRCPRPRNMDSICNRSRRCIQIGIRRTRCYLRSQQISHDKEHHSRRSCSTLQDIGRQIRTQGRNDLIAKFQRSITPPRLRRIVSYKEEPTTILGWYKAAIAADNTDRRINEDIDRFKRENPKPTPTTRTLKYYNSSNNYSNTYRQPYRDPNAMDVDAINLSPEERNKRMKQGQCFTLWRTRS